MAISEAWVDFLAGWISGGISVLVCQPVDTVLTRLQAGPALVATTATTAPISVQTRGLVSQSGLTALWRGSSAMISAVPMQNALLMGGYGIGKKWSEDTKGTEYDMTMLSVFVGGCTGGLVQSFLMSPVELYKVNQQVIGQAPQAARKEIFQGLKSSQSWRGLNATLLRDGIPHGVWFASYEWCKTVLGVQLQDAPGAQFTVPLVSGAFAATMAWVSRYIYFLSSVVCRVVVLWVNMGWSLIGIVSLESIHSSMSKEYIFHFVIRCYARHDWALLFPGVGCHSFIHLRSREYTACFLCYFWYSTHLSLMSFVPFTPIFIHSFIADRWLSF
jgi:solute carrier family 25 carnitine/acylcarnitine transporter 20/29